MSLPPGLTVYTEEPLGNLNKSVLQLAAVIVHIPGNPLQIKRFEGADEFPGRESVSVSKMDMLTKKSVPMDLLLKGPEEQKVSKV